ncbi:TipAS antibiotic-recognition domain-containing protein [Blastococcus brunescens]|uniref:TipAS antibiotic-recognition domain-containing protein n=1 Tax=Blastococcus brunescens TaxID=1564165 RepID=A0ABZ1B4Z2_9ACTN|nr:TipAS antibiotic-recognition domain-containing protein [Blastococcus sp. BMG 8361]WRL64090.1 TipAS antibiotic-recognition domain-containing protein [Blastococcus sp. BMG 8361]
MHAGLGRMYVEDERFTATYEAMAPGLAKYVSTANQANAARQG